MRLSPSETDANLLDHLAQTARKGAGKAARQQPDSDEFAELAGFIHTELARGQPSALLQLEARLRREDRRALAWYLNIVRTLSGTVQVGESLQHLLFIPLQLRPAAGAIDIGSASHEIAAGLEQALDLGSNSLQLHTQVLGFVALEQLTPLDWHAIAKGAPSLPAPSGSASSLGVIVGHWRVDVRDRARLSRKLVHAMQRTPALNAWKVRTEGLLEERAAGSKVRVFPAVLLQDVFTLLRQLQLNTLLEYAMRQVAKPAVLRWHWAEPAGELSWRLGESAGEVQGGSSLFPDEPVELVEQQLIRLAQRLQFQLSPPISPT
jgi:hypothetical protein